MRTFAFLPALLIAASASAQSASFSLTFTAENGGADTRLTWNYTGSPTIVPLPTTSVLYYSTIDFDSGPARSGVNYSLSGSAGQAYTSAPASITGLNTGLTLTNTTTNDFVTITNVSFYSSPGSAFLTLGFNLNSIRVNAGEALVISGPTTGSFLVGSAFSNFQEGSWTVNTALYQNFGAVMTVGGTPAVPEPSTYGLALGGLALAGAAVRRRRISK